MSTLKKWGGIGIYLIPLLFLAIFFFYPLLSILHTSFTQNDKLDFNGFIRLATTDFYLRTLWFTIWQATLSTILTVALAIPGAYVFTRFKFPGKSLLLSLATLPFVLPTVVVAIAFTSLLGKNGLVNTALMQWLGLENAPIMFERTLAAIIIVHIFYNYAIALRMISGFWMNLSPRIEDAAQTLGCQGWKLWWYVRLPLLRPAIMSATALVFIFTFTSFGVVLILGGLRYATLEVEIYQQTVALFDLPMAAALSVVQIVIMFVLMMIYTRLQQNRSISIQSTKTIEKAPKNLQERLLIISNILFISVMLFSPLIALVMRSLTAANSGISLENYTRLSQNTRGSILFVPPIEALFNSLFFAVITMLVAGFLGVTSAYLIHRKNRWTRLLDPVFMLPLATSAVTLGFGYVITLNSTIDTLILIPIVHTLVALPFVIRSVLPALRSIHPNIREASTVLGASSWQTLRQIELPLISRALVVGLTFAFTVSMGEFGASIFLARPDTPTMPIAIYRLSSQPGIANFGQSLAMSVILLFICGLSFVLIERLRTQGVGEF